MLTIHASYLSNNFSSIDARMRVAQLIERHNKEPSSVAVLSSNPGQDVNFSFLNKNNKIQTLSIHYICIILNSTLTNSYDLQRRRAIRWRQSSSISDA